MTRAELCQRTGYTPGAVTKALQPLLAAGLVRERTEQWTANGAGRPAFPLEVDAEHACLIGVKITADEIIAVLTDLRARVLDTAHLPLSSTKELDPHTAVTVVVDAVQQLVAQHPEHEQRVSAIGVAVSGDVDTATGAVRFAPLLGWRDVPLAAMLAARIDLPVLVENDVRALTVAEQLFGAGLDCPSFALVTVGTGVGCGIVVRDELITGGHGVAGELGHLPLDPTRRRCHCGGRGCVEASIGAPALLERVSAAVGAPVSTLAVARSIAQRRSGRAARAVFEDVGRLLGLALASVANLVGPERIVLSGETLAAYDLFADAMLATFQEQGFGAAKRCEIVVRPLQFEHWARGAAAVAIARLVAAQV
jgi:predicted NBD/HSP70 family sugar kinase